MKSLALAVVLFCSLAALLGYVATSGIGVRVASGPPVVVDRTAQLESKAQAPVVEVKAQRLPVKDQAPPAKKPGSPSPLAPETKVRRHRVVAVKPDVPAVPFVRPQPAVHVVERPPVPKQAVALAAPRHRQEPEHQTAAAPPVQAAPAPVPEPETDKDTLQRQIEEDRKWRRSVLARWAREEKERKAKEQDAIKNEFDSDGRLRPRDKIEKDSEPASKVDKPKKKKRRHRFLMIRW